LLVCPEKAAAEPMNTPTHIEQPDQDIAIPLCTAGGEQPLKESFLRIPQLYPGSGKYRLLLFFIFVFQSNMSGQKGHYRDNKFFVALSPLALADIFDGASGRVSAEFKLHRNITLSTEGGTYFNYIHTSKIDPRGFLVKPCVKYYLNKDGVAGGRYLALEYLYKNQDYDFKDSMATASIRFERQYPMNRVVHSLSVKYGNVANYGRHFILEWYCGAGVRYIRSKSGLTTNEADAILEGDENGCLFQESFIRKTGNIFSPNIVAGIKIGYSIK
jgi:hypothetical protein